MDSTLEHAIVIHRLDRSQMKFVEYANGLYVYIPTQKATYHESTGYTLLNTVKQQKLLFTKRDVENADAARKFTAP
jgi:hypothetical protein